MVSLAFGTTFHLWHDGAVAKAKRPAERREDALSNERIVEAAIELLDAQGEEGLTFRALATHLSTGAGAIYWHVANKSELLAAASDAVVMRALTGVVERASAKKTIRSIALVVFEAVDAHPWVGDQLARNPWPKATLQIFERIGRQIEALKVPGRARFRAAGVLVSYIISESRQNAANGSLPGPRPDRAEYLATIAAQWKALDATEYAFTREVAAHLRDHDDTEEFLAGIDLVLAGIAAL